MMCRYWLLALFFANQVLAAGPNEVSYQGFIQDSGGTPINGTVTLQLDVWTSPTSQDNNDLLYRENHPGVTVSNGLFSIQLGGGDAIIGFFDADLFSDDNRWLQTTVDGVPQSPRTKFLSVPYAMQAQQAETLSGLSGAVMHFALPQCPPGWSELVDARGRTLVGLPAGGTLQGTNGVPLSNLETRQHVHHVSIPQTGSFPGGEHQHSVSSGTTGNDTHNHRWSVWDGPNLDWLSFNSAGNSFTITNWIDGMDGAGAGLYPITASSSSVTTIYTDNDTHSHSIASTSTQAAGDHSHTLPAISLFSSTADSAPALPYIQLLVCVKD